MIKSGKLLIASAALIVATLAISTADIQSSESGLLQDYSTTARHWSRVNYYDNQGGYQTVTAKSRKDVRWVIQAL